MEKARTQLQELEIQHADASALEDIENATALATDQSDLEQGYFLKAPLLGSIFAISLAVVATYWGFALPAAVLTTINADIGPSDNASLFSIIWSTCVGIGGVLFGRISDKFGRRYFVIGASVMGFVGGIIACTAKDMNTLIGANVLLGLGGGVHTCYTLLVGEICPNKYKYLGVVICVIPNIIPTGFSAYIALLIVHETNWRWIYYIQLMMMAPAIALQWWFYVPPSFKQLHGGSRTVMQELKRIDFVGCFLLVSGLTLFLLGVSWGGQPIPWASARIIGLLVSGGLTLVVFVLWEIYSKVPNVLVPMHVFRDLRGFVCSIIIVSVAGVMYIGASIIWPSQVAQIYGSSSTDWRTNAWLSTTIAFGIYGGIVLVGLIFHLVKHIRLQLIFFAIMATAFSGALSSCNANNRAQSAAFSFLASFGAGPLEIFPGILVQLETLDADLGTVFAILLLVKNSIGSIMTAVFLAILQNKLPGEVAKYVPEAALNAGLPESSLADLGTALGLGTPAALAAVPGINPTIEIAIAQGLSSAYAAAYAYVYYAVVACGLVALIAAFAMKDYDHFLTGHVSKQIYTKGKESNLMTKQYDDVETKAVDGENKS